jgi:hypothetical protein
VREATLSQISLIGPELRVKVNVPGRPLLNAPKIDAYVRNSRIPLLPWVSGGEAHTGPEMKDSRLWEIFVGSRVRLGPDQQIIIPASGFL